MSMKTPDFEDFLTSREVGELVRLSPASLSRMRQRGVGPAFVLLMQGTPRYLRRDVVAWLESGYRKTRVKS